MFFEVEYRHNMILLEHCWSGIQSTNVLFQMLPHPSFVYCAQFHPGNSSVLVTGCSDHVVRVWKRPYKSLQFEVSKSKQCYQTIECWYLTHCFEHLKKGYALHRRAESSPCTDRSLLNMYIL